MDQLTDRDKARGKATVAAAELATKYRNTPAARAARRKNAGAMTLREKLENHQAEQTTREKTKAGWSERQRAEIITARETLKKTDPATTRYFFRYITREVPGSMKPFDGQEITITGWGEITATVEFTKDGLAAGVSYLAIGAAPREISGQPAVDRLNAAFEKAVKRGGSPRQTAGQAVEALRAAADMATIAIAAWARYLESGHGARRGEARDKIAEARKATKDALKLLQKTIY